jgi:hypothetical protein
LEALNLYRPRVYEFARLNITYTVRTRLCFAKPFADKPLAVACIIGPTLMPLCDDAAAVEAEAAQAGQVQPGARLGRPTHAHHQG